MKPKDTGWVDPSGYNFGFMPYTTGNLWSGLEVDGQLMGKDPTGGIGNNFQDDLNMAGFWGYGPYSFPFFGNNGN